MNRKTRNSKSSPASSRQDSGLELGGAAWKRIIVEGAGSMGVSVDARQADLFALHAEELALWNRKVNLTAITDPLAVAVKHFLDSCAVSPLLSDSGRILDIGAGGGFPGVPISVLHRGAVVDLVDASRKKVSFLQYVKRMMGVGNFSAHHARVEALEDQPEFRQSFDVVVSRAFSELDLFVSLSLPFLKPGGQIIAMKGPAEADGLTGTEYRMNGADGNEPSAVFSMAVQGYRLPYLGDKRSLVVLRQKPDGRG